MPVPIRPMDQLCEWLEWEKNINTRSMTRDELLEYAEEFANYWINIDPTTIKQMTKEEIIVAGAKAQMLFEQEEERRRKLA